MEHFKNFSFLFNFWQCSWNSELLIYLIIFLGGGHGGGEDDAMAEYRKVTISGNKNID